jgi:hypothetical protein
MPFPDLIIASKLRNVSPLASKVPIGHLIFLKDLEVYRIKRKGPSIPVILPLAAQSSLSPKTRTFLSPSHGGFGFIGKLNCLKKQNDLNLMGQILSREKSNYDIFFCQPESNSVNERIKVY